MGIAILGGKRRIFREVLGGGSVTPFLVEDFSTYSSMADLLSDPRSIYKASEQLTPEQMALNTTFGYGSSPQCLEYIFPDRTADGDRCTDYSISLSTIFPNDGNIQEVWVEVAIKTTVGFLTQAPASWGCSSGQGYKLLDLNVDPGDRFSIGLLTGDNPPITGQMWFGYPDNITDEDAKVDFTDPRLTSFNAVDGGWHVYKIHGKISTGYPGAPNADGILQGWIDGVLVVNKTNIVTTSAPNNTNVPPSQFTFLSLGRNINQGPAVQQSLYRGLIKIYGTDPGWT